MISHTGPCSERLEHGYAQTRIECEDHSVAFGPNDTDPIQIVIGACPDVCRASLTGLKAVGAGAFQDLSAYSRTLDHGNPTRAEAEAILNGFMADAKRSVAFPDRAWAQGRIGRQTSSLH